jgi:hypothetical protein
LPPPPNPHFILQRLSSLLARLTDFCGLLHVGGCGGTL